MTTFSNFSSSFNRAANTTEYTAHTAVGNSTTAVLTVNGGGILTWTPPPGAQGPVMGKITGLTMLKSGETTTNADFVVWLYSAPPYVGTTVKDDVAYVGPFAVDLPNLIGYATCGTPTATSDGTAQVWYDGTLSNPNQEDVLDYNLGTGATIYGIIEVTAAYTPASGEMFTVFLTGTTAG